MLSREVATGRRMNGAEMCMYGPGCFPLLLLSNGIYSVRGGQAAVRFQEFRATYPNRAAARTVPADSQFARPYNKLKPCAPSADKIYCKCNLAYIRASQ